MNDKKGADFMETLKIFFIAGYAAYLVIKVTRYADAIKNYLKTL